MKARITTLIDKHLLGQLSPKEAHEWKKVRRAPEVLKELSFRRDLIAAAIPEGRANLKKELQALEAGLINPAQDHEIFGPVTPVRPLWQKPQLWAAAAGIALLAAFAYFFSLNKAPEDAAVIFAEAWQPYPNELRVQVRGGGTKPSSLDAAMRLYDAQRYDEAIIALSNIKTPQDTIAFYRANALLATGKTTLARTIFASIEQSSDHPYQEESSWYLALMDIQVSNIARAKRRLTAMGNNRQHPFSSQANTLLAKLP